MSDPMSVFPIELAEIGLVAFADPNYCERLLAALDRMAGEELPARPACSPEADAQNAPGLAA